MTPSDFLPPSGSAPAAGPGPRILLVDDDAILRRLYGAALTRAGYAVELAPDGMEAWSALQARRFDLLITDLEMPQMDGLELVGTLRRHRIAIPIIVATGSSLVSQLFADAEIVPEAILLKPFSRRLLLETARKVLLPAGFFSPHSADPRKLALDEFDDSVRQSVGPAGVRMGGDDRR